jgi:hypothetical protein
MAPVRYHSSSLPATWVVERCPSRAMVVVSEDDGYRLRAYVGDMATLTTDRYHGTDRSLRQLPTASRVVASVSEVLCGAAQRQRPCSGRPERIGGVRRISPASRQSGSATRSGRRHHLDFSPTSACYQPELTPSESPRDPLVDVASNFAPGSLLLDLLCLSSTSRTTAP